MSSGSYYTSNTYSDRNPEFHDSSPYTTTSSTQRATPSYPSNNDHAFLTLYSQRGGSLVPITPASHTPHGILSPPPQPDPSRKYRCSECSKCFDRPSSLNTHMVTHTGESLFPCTECNKTFNVKSNRTRHMRERHNIHDSDTSSSSSNRGFTTRYHSSAASATSSQTPYYYSK